MDSSEVTTTKTKGTATRNDVRLKNGSLHTEKKKASTPTTQGIQYVKPQSKT